MRIFITIFALIIAVATLGKESVCITILHTSDTHGHLVYSQNLANLYQQYRTKNTLLIDCGDTIQGSFSAQQDCGKATIDTLNRLKYDIWVIGNHDSDFGGAVLNSRIAQFRGTSLAGNWSIYSSPLPAWQMFEFEGVKVAVIGLGRGDQLIRDLYVKEFLTVSNELDVIAPLVQQTKQAGADIVILAWHGGMYDRSGGGHALIAKAPDIDLILGGHTHQAIAGANVRTGFFAQSGKHAEGLGVVQLTLEDGKLQQTTGFIVPLPDTHHQDHSPLVVELPYYIEASKADKRPLPHTSWASKILKEQCHADIGIYSTSLRQYSIPKRLTQYELFQLFPYEDRAVTFEVSYNELVAILEEFIAKRRQNIFHEFSISGIKVECTARELKILEITPKRSTYKIAISSFLASSGNGKYPTLNRLYQTAPDKHHGELIRTLIIANLPLKRAFDSEIWLKEIKK